MRDKGFALLLATWASIDGTDVFPSRQRLVADSGLSESTVKRRMKTLRERGWLELVKSANDYSGQAAKYYLVIPDEVAPMTLAVPLRVTREPVKGHRDSDSGSPVTQPGVAREPLQSHNQIKPNQYQPIEGRRLVVPSEVESLERLTEQSNEHRGMEFDDASGRYVDAREKHSDSDRPERHRPTWQEDY